MKPLKIVFGVGCSVFALFVAGYELQRWAWARIVEAVTQPWRP